MDGTSRATLFLAASLTLSACHRGATPESTAMVRGCTTRLHSKGVAPQLPRSPSLRPGYGGVVGTLADSGGALPHFPILAVVPGDDPSSPHASATPDSVGGFAFDSLPPGHYRLFVRAFGHRPDSTNVDVSAGRVDTVRIVLRLFECVR